MRGGWTERPAPSSASNLEIKSRVGWCTVLTMARWLVLVALAGCAGDVSDGRPPLGQIAPDAMALPGTDSIARAQLWVDAKVPYCQAANHQHDNDSACAATCERPDVPDWDPYRSDCSGFVSWAWGLPAPGRTTAELAPFTTDLTHAIEGADLRAGDAVNNSDHVMLFEAWTQQGVEAKFLEETGCSSSTPYAVEVTESVSISGQTVTVQYHGTFTAIRYDQAP